MKLNPSVTKTSIEESLRRATDELLRQHEGFDALRATGGRMPPVELSKELQLEFQWWVAPQKIREVPMPLAQLTLRAKSIPEDAAEWFEADSSVEETVDTLVSTLFVLLGRGRDYRANYRGKRPSYWKRDDRNALAIEAVLPVNEGKVKSIRADFDRIDRAFQSATGKM